MFFFLSKVLDIFLCPYTWGVLLFAAAVPWGRRRARRWRRRRAYGIAGLAVLLVSGMGPISHLVQYRLEHAETSTYRADATYDAVILLGGLVDQEATAENGQATYNDAVERLITTSELLARGRARHVIVSAATSPEFPDSGEANVIARQLEAWGIAKERILVEDKARNTRENALFSQAIAKDHGFSTVLVVTSAAHMSRAKGCFDAVGMQVDTLAVDYRSHARAGASLGDWIPRVDGLADMSGTLHELFGRLVYRARGYSR
ncbi:MAG: YdcF family protein [Deltaproteobacteria bacterium]|nr:YdcF family protein [Deltaproteobacteria bacterium]